MSNNQKIKLITLSNGLHPIASPLDCEDVRGQHSLFGESARIPRPVCTWDPVLTDNVNRPRLTCAERDALYGCRLLWQSEKCTDILESAARIAAEEPLQSNDDTVRLSMPATYFIAGRCTSTFPLAWSLSKHNLLPEWGGVICSCQSEGRGQLRRPWHSPRGNLYVSFRLPADPLLMGDTASLVAGYIVLKAFHALNFPLMLKWPNDLLIHEQCKVGGILLEEREGVLLTGIGINLVEAPGPRLLREGSAIPAGVLLPHHAHSVGDSWLTECVKRQEEPLAPFALWRRLVSEAILAYSRSVAGRKLVDVLAELEKHLAWKGQELTLSEPDGESVVGRFLGLGPGGGARMALPGEHVHEFFSGSFYRND